jgi:CRP-like cAMP-binding protein
MTLESVEDEDVEIYDYASTGIVVGEMGCLVGENAQLSVICETAVKTYQIPVEVIKDAYTQFPKLLDTLWSNVGMKIAVPLMLRGQGEHI